MAITNEQIGAEVRELMTNIIHAEKIDCTCKKHHLAKLPCKCEKGKVLQAAGQQLGDYFRLLKEEIIKNG